MRMKKVFSMSMALVITAALLVGCSGGKKTSTSGSNEGVTLTFRECIQRIGPY